MSHDVPVVYFAKQNTKYEKTVFLFFVAFNIIARSEN